MVLPAQGEIGPSVGSDIVNVEASVDDGKVVYADVQFEYICEGACYFQATIIRFAAHPTSKQTQPSRGLVFVEILS